MSELRIGDAERNSAAEELAEHYAQGRLSTEEHSERLDRIWAARTPSDLASVFGDLPGSAYRPPASYRNADRPGVGSDRPRAQRPFPAATYGRPPYAGEVRRRFGMLPVLVRSALAVVLAMLVIAHLPLIVVALVIWLLLSHKHRGRRSDWQREWKSDRYGDWHGHRARC